MSVRALLGKKHVVEKVTLICKHHCSSCAEEELQNEGKEVGEKEGETKVVIVGPAVLPLAVAGGVEQFGHLDHLRQGRAKPNDCKGIPDAGGEELEVGEFGAEVLPVYLELSLRAQVDVRLEVARDRHQNEEHHHFELETVAPTSPL